MQKGIPAPLKKEVKISILIPEFVALMGGGEQTKMNLTLLVSDFKQLNEVLQQNVAYEAILYKKSLHTFQNFL